MLSTGFGQSSVCALRFRHAEAVQPGLQAAVIEQRQLHRALRVERLREQRLGARARRRVDRRNAAGAGRR